MTRNVLSPHWTGGDRAEPIDPATIRFKVAPGGDEECVGCMFINQLSPVCRRAAAIAKAAGGFDCDEPLPNGRSVIYQIHKVDPRQTDFVSPQEK